LQLSRIALLEQTPSILAAWAELIQAIKRAIAINLVRVVFI